MINPTKKLNALKYNFSIYRQHQSKNPNDANMQNINFQNPAPKYQNIKMMNAEETPTIFRVDKLSASNKYFKIELINNNAITNTKYI